MAIKIKDEETCCKKESINANLPGYKPFNCIDCGKSFPRFYRNGGRSGKLCCVCLKKKTREAAKKKHMAKNCIPAPPSWVPRVEKFQSMEEITEYMSGEWIQCLLCGISFRSLNGHLGPSHNMTDREYKRIFGIPLTTGIASEASKQKSAIVGHRNYEKIIAAGIPLSKMGTAALKSSGKQGENSALWSPALVKKQLDVVKKMLASPNKLSADKNKPAIAPCSRCGQEFISNEIAIMHSRCRILCENCRENSYAESVGRWLAKNRERRREYRVAYKSLKSGDENPMKEYKKKYQGVGNG